MVNFGEFCLLLLIIDISNFMAPTMDTKIQTEAMDRQDIFFYKPGKKLKTNKHSGLAPQIMEAASCPFFFFK